METNLDITALDDAFIEGSENINITISNPQDGGAFEGITLGNSTADMNIIDSTTPQEANTVYAQISVDKTVVDEGGNLIYTVTLVDRDGNLVDVPIGESVTVNLAWSGEASGGDDTTGTLPSTIDITGGNNTTFTVQTKDDYLKEGQEPIIATITDVVDNDSNFEAVAPSTNPHKVKAVSEIDDEAPANDPEDTVYVRLGQDASTLEADGAVLTHKITLVDKDGNEVNLAVNESIKLELEYSSDTTSEADFKENGKKTIVTIIGDGSSSYNFENVVADDFIPETNESYTVKIKKIVESNTNFENLEIDNSNNGVNNQAIGTIQSDNNENPTSFDTVYAEIYVDKAVVTEGNQNVTDSITYTVKLVDKDRNEVTVPAGNEITVNLNWSGVAEANDIVETLPTSITIDENTNQNTFTIHPEYDQANEGSETLIVEITNVSEAVNSDDFEALAPSSHESTRKVTSLIVDDLTQVPENTTFLRLDDDVTVKEGDDVSITHTIKLVDVNGDPIVLAQGETITLNLHYADGNANEERPDDKDFKTNGKISQVTITGDGSSTYTFTNTIMDDYLKEGNESYAVSIESIVSNTATSLSFLGIDAAHNKAIATIRDGADDETPNQDIDTVYAQIEVDKSTSVVEGEDLTYIVKLVDKNGNEVVVPSGEEVKVQLDWSGTASNGADTSILPSEVSITNGSTTTFIVNTKDDYLKEGDEPLTVTVASATDVNDNFENLAPSTSNATATSTLTDEPAGTIAEPIDTVYLRLGGDDTVGEGDNQTLSHTISLVDYQGNAVNLEAGESITVNLKYTNEGTSIEDFANGGKTTTLIINGDGGNTYDLTNTIKDDFLNEGDESYTVSIDTITANTTPRFENLAIDTSNEDANNKAVGTIQDGVNDVIPNQDIDTVYAVLTGANSVNEGSSTVYNVKLLDINGNEVSVSQDTTVQVRFENLSTNDADTDHTHNDIIDVIIPAGSSNANFTIEAKDDYLNETSENYKVTIDSIPSHEFENIDIDGFTDSNSVEHNATQTTTINTDAVANEPVDTVYAKIEVDKTSLKEGGDVTYTVTLVDKDENPVTLPADKSVDVTIDWGNSTTQNADTSTLPTSITIAGGTNNKQFTVNTKNDLDIDDGETLIPTLTGITDTNQVFENATVDSTIASISTTTTITDGLGIEITTTKADLIVDETTLNTDSTVDLSTIFDIAYNAGNAGEKTFTKEYALAVKSDGEDSGLLDSQTGDKILLKLENGKVIGYTENNGNETVFELSINQATGEVSLDQQRAVSHTDGTNPDDSISLNADDLVTLSVTSTITDNDDDSLSDSASVNIGQNLIFKDDAPSITVSTLGDEAAQKLIVDDTALTTNPTTDDTKDFSGFFTSTSSAGADGQASLSTVYSLEVKSANIESGLFDTATNEAIVLSKNAQGEIEGKTQTSGELVFTVSVNNSGSVTLEQERAIKHSNTSSDDESVSLSADDLISLKREDTITDNDGDSTSSSASINIGENLEFKDDGPSVSAISGTGSTPYSNVSDANLGIDYTNTLSNYFSGGIGNTGADGGSISEEYTLGVSSNGADSGLVDTQTGDKVLLKLEDGKVIGYTENNANLTVFELSIDASTGNTILDQQRAIKHPDGSDGVNIDGDKVTTTKTVTVTDGDGDSASANHTINHVLVFADDAPTAKADVDVTITENTSTSNTTNLLANDTPGADGLKETDKIAGFTYTDTNGDEQTGTLGTAATTKTGQLTVNADGTWSFEANKSVNNPAGANVEETFTYTIEDKDGDTSNANQKIIIKDTDPSLSLTAQTVQESDLPTGTTPSENEEAVSATFTINTLDELASTKALTIVNKDGDDVDLSLNELQNLNTINQTIETTNGEIKLTNYDSTTGVVSYTYTLGQAVTNVNGANFDENITIKVYDEDNPNKAISDTLTIYIQDDAPIANADANSIAEDAGVENTQSSTNPTVSNNVIDNTGDDTQDDVLGADGSTVVGVQAGTVGAGQNVSGSVGSTVSGTYGNLTINSNGEYTYTLKDNDGLSLQELTKTESVDDVFTYTIEDADGSKSTTTLTIAVNGTDDNVTLNIVDANGAGETGHQTVKEEALANGSNPTSTEETVSGVFTLKALDGLSENSAIVLSSAKLNETGTNSLTLSKAEVETLASTNKTLDTGEGQLVLNGYTQNQNTGEITINYTYTLENAVINQAGTDYFDEISITVTDDDASVSGQSAEVATDTLQIKIVDDTGDTQTVEVNEDSLDNIIRTSSNATQDNITINNTQANNDNEVAVTHGTVKILADGNLEYTPNGNYSGKETFTYEVTIGANTETHTVNIDVKPFAENELKADDTDVPMTLVGSPGSVTDNNSITKYNMTNTVYNDEDTAAVDIKMPDFRDLLLDNSNAKDAGGLEEVGVVTISGIPNGAIFSYVDNAGDTQTINVNGDVTLDLATLQDEGSHFNYTLSNLPSNSNADFTVKYSFTVTDTATMQDNSDASDTQKFEVSQKIDMLGVADLDESKFATTNQIVAENTSINLNTLINDTGIFTDTDGSETQTFVITGLPSDVVASAGTLTDGASGTKTLTITKAQLDANANIKVPDYDGSYDLSITAKSQENDHNDTQGTNPTKEDTDTSKVDNDADGQGYKEATKNVTLTVSPDAKDTQVVVSSKETPEDTQVGLDIDFASSDNLGKLEEVTSVTISAIPNGAKLYKADGTEITVNANQATLTIGTNPGEYSLADIQGLKILPPAHSSSDFTLTISADVKEGSATHNITQTQKIIVSPVAERTDTNSDGANGNDVTMNDDHTYTIAGEESDGTEATAFDISAGLDQTAWSNEDSDGSETTYATLTLQHDDNLSVGGEDWQDTDTATFTYDKGTAGNPDIVTIVSSPANPAKIPVEHLNTVKVIVPEGLSGDFKVKVQASTEDTDPDSGVVAKDIRGEAYINFTLNPSANTATLTAIDSEGNEDVGREDDGSVKNTPEGIKLDIKVDSTDADGSESFTVKIDKLPDGGTLWVWDGSAYQAVTYNTDTSAMSNITVTNDTAIPDNVTDIGKANNVTYGDYSTWTVEIANYDNEYQPIFVPPANSDFDYIKHTPDTGDNPIHTLNSDNSFEVSAKTTDTAEGVSDTGAYGTPIKLGVKVNAIADGFENNTLINKTVQEDDGIVISELYETYDTLGLKDGDTSEEGSFIITGLQNGFTIVGIGGFNPEFLGGIGEKRQWKVTKEELNDIKVVTPKDFSGDTTFDIIETTTEKNGGNMLSVTQEVTVKVNPVVDSALSTSGEHYENEDSWHALDLSFANIDEYKEGGTNIEKLTKIIIDPDDLPLGAKIKYDGNVYENVDGQDEQVIEIPVTYTGETPQIPTIEVLNPLNAHEDYTFPIKYEVQDGEVSTEKESTYAVIVGEITDDVTLETIDTSTDDTSHVTITNTDDDGENDDIVMNIATNDVVSFTKTIKLESFDKDSSEMFTRVVVENVPEGVSVKYTASGSEIEGVITSSDNTKNTWVLNIPNESIEENGAIADIIFETKPGIESSGQAEVTIKAYAKDLAPDEQGNTSDDIDNLTDREKFAEDSFTLEVNVSDGDGPITVYGININLDGTANGVEGELSNTLNVVNSVTYPKDGPGPDLDPSGKNFSVVLQAGDNFPYGAKLESTYGNGTQLKKINNDTWILEGNDADHIQDAINGIKVDLSTADTPAHEFSTNDTNANPDEYLHIKVNNINVYNDTGEALAFESFTDKVINVNIKPVTDEFDANGGIISASGEEDTLTEFTIDLTNTNDTGAYTQIVDGKLYIELTSQNGTFNNEKIVDENGNINLQYFKDGSWEDATYVSGKYVLDVGENYTASSSQLNVRFTPNENTDGTVSFEVTGQNQETGADNIVDFTETVNVTINPVADDVSITLNSLDNVANEDEWIWLNDSYEFEFDDPSEKIVAMSINLGEEVTNDGGIIFYIPKGGSEWKMATNIGDGIWNITITNNEKPDYICAGIKSNFNGTVPVQMSVISDTGKEGHSQIVDMPVHTIADELPSDPTPTIGYEYGGTTGNPWIALNLNANVKDESETIKMTMKAQSGEPDLEEGMQFAIKNADGYTQISDDKISFANGEYVVSDISAKDINNISIIYPNYKGKLDISLQTTDEHIYYTAEDIVDLSGDIDAHVNVNKQDDGRFLVTVKGGTKLPAGLEGADGWTYDSESGVYSQTVDTIAQVQALQINAKDIIISNTSQETNTLDPEDVEANEAEVSILQSPEVTGTDEADNIDLSGATDPVKVEAKAGDDIIKGGAGDDKLYGETGNDEIYGNQGDDLLRGAQGDDEIYGGAGADEIHGGADQDTLYGEDGADTIHGDTGADIIHGNAGADKLYGGEGNDYIYIDSNDTVNGGEGTDTVHLQGQGIDFSKVTNIEKIDLTQDANILSGLSLDDVLDMTDGDNELEILGDSSDSVDSVDTTGWTKGNETDNGDSVTYEYTNDTTNDTIKLTVDDNVVNNTGL